MLKKEGLFLIFFVSVLFLTGFSSALGVSPAVKQFNFQPNFEKDISYRVFEPNPDMELEMYVEGDLAEYVTLDMYSMIGGGTFTAHLKLPEKIETPGPHRILIGVKQKVDKELIQGVGTAVVILVPIYIHVPYPGRYLEIELKGHDVNVGEIVNFELYIDSKGKEDVSVIPRIEIYSFENKIDTLLFNPRTIKSQQSLRLKKELNTSGYNPGNYRARAVVDYGALAEDEVDFRIGSLNIEIVGYTSQLTIGKLQPFNVEIESGWNDQIDGAYAEVVMSNETRILDSFKTTSTTLVPWQAKNVTGYLDTSNYTEGFYDANITVFYYGKEIGKTTSKIVSVEFIKMKSLLVWYIIGGAGLFVIILLLGIKFFSKRKRKNGKTKKK